MKLIPHRRNNDKRAECEQQGRETDQDPMRVHSKPRCCTRSERFL